MRAVPTRSRVPLDAWAKSRQRGYRLQGLGKRFCPPYGHVRDASTHRLIHLRKNFLNLGPGLVARFVAHLPGGVGTLERNAVRGLEVRDLPARARTGKKIEIAAP